MIFHPSTKKVSRYLDGLLSEATTRSFEAHLAGCAACRRKVEVLRSAARLCCPSKQRLEAVSQNVMTRVGQVDFGELSRVGNLSSAGQVDSPSDVGQVGNLSIEKPRWNTTAPILAEVRLVEGTVFIRNAANEEPVEAFPGCALRQGDRLEPIGGSSVAVEGENGVACLVTETADVSSLLQGAAQASRGGAGTLWAAIRKQLQACRAWEAAVGVAAVAVLCVIMFNPFSSETRRIRIIGGVDQWPVVSYEPSPIAWADLVGRTLYVKKTPKSRGGGSYPTSVIVGDAKAPGMHVQTFDLKPRDVLRANPEQVEAFGRDVKEVLETMLYHKTGVSAAQKEGRRMWYDPTTQKITIADSKENIAKVAEFLNAVPQLEPTDRYHIAGDLAAQMEVPATPNSPAITPKTASGDSQTEKRLVIYTAQFSILVGSVADSMKDLLQKIEKWNGYVQTADLQRVTFRVPAANFNRVVEEISQLGVVTNKQVQAQDVTRQYMDLQLRIEVAETSRKRLLALLEEADKTEDLLKIENEIRRLTEEIERLKGELRTVADQVVYSTIAVDLTAKAAEAKPARPRGGRSYFAWINQIGAEHVIRTF
jgi:hypothetical protein